MFSQTQGDCGLHGLPSVILSRCVRQAVNEIPAVPVEIRRKWDLEKGDLVAFVETEQGVLISPREVLAMEALDRIGEALKEEGISLEEMIEGGREIRGKILEEEYGIKVDDE